MTVRTQCLQKNYSQSKKSAVGGERPQDRCEILLNPFVPDAYFGIPGTVFSQFPKKMFEFSHLLQNNSSLFFNWGPRDLLFIKIIFRIFLELKISIHRTGQIQFLVKWENYPETDNSWEHEDNCHQCIDKIEEFLEEQR